MDPNVILLNDTIEERFRAARKVIEEYEDFVRYQYDHSDATSEDREGELKERLEWSVCSIYFHIAVLGEKIGLKGHAKFVRDELKTIQADPMRKLSLQTIEHHDESDSLYSPALMRLHLLYEPLLPLMSTKVTTSIDVLERILKRTPDIVSKRYSAKGASKEKDVEICVLEVLKHSFSDADCQIVIPQKTKNYVLDLGVHSLMTGVEVKFARNKPEFKKAVGELYTDMKGYSGDHRWRKFYALIYLKNHIPDAEKLFDEFKDVKAPLNWIPIIATELKPDTTAVSKAKPPITQ